MSVQVYRDRIRVDRPKRGIVDPETNEQLLEWEEFGSYRANVETLASRETARVRAAVLSTTRRVTTRYTTAITSDCRIRYTIGDREHVLAIDGIRPVNGRREIELLCVEEA